MSIIRLPHIGESFSAKRFFVWLKEIERYVRAPETQGFRTVGCDRSQLSKDILLKYQKTLVICV